MNNIVLSNGVRQNLLSLQKTSTLSQETQLRLATGKDVNSALDNPVNFFTSAALNTRTDALKGLLDGISNGVQTITAASQGIESIVKLVQSAQATIRQAQNEAAQNRPSRTGATALANASETAALNKSAQDVALDKLVEGSAAAAATTTSPGSLGVAASSTVTIAAGPTTYTFTTSATMTLRDLVNEVNKSGIATGSVDSSGRFTVAGLGSDTLNFTVGDAANTQRLGYSAADATALTGPGIASTATSAVRTNLIEQFNLLRTQIDKLAQDSSYNGTNLLNGDRLSIVFNEKTGAQRNTLELQSSKLTAASLGIIPAGNSTVAGQTNIQNDSELNAAAASLTGALSSLQSLSSMFGANLAVVNSRQDFTQNLMTTLRSGADNLVIADTNEEGANLLALQTRQQLSQTALSLASQADQSVLKLFG
jgi:flagellin-like hook-associated protein FlgL